MQVPPALHCLGAAQTGLDPQRHSPSGPQPSPCFPQSTHAEPLAPHLLSVIASQWVASRQQPAQLAASQAVPAAVQAPAVQVVLLPQAGVAPQRQLPAGEQLSALAGLQAVQTPPPVPQKPTAATLQTPIAQQPLGHVVALQAIGMQLPPMHLFPAAQAGLAPHWHAPAAEHESAIRGSQEAQAAPAAPQAVAVRAVVHVEPVQQPFGQLAAVHGLLTQVLLMHCWLAPHAGPVPHLQAPVVQLLDAFGLHATQAAPRVPQVDDVLVWQTFPAQQPLAHDVASQTHWLLRQRVPGPHAGPEPQVHVPEVQLLAVVALQATHAAPGSAQLDSDWAVQTVPAQQPLAQEEASQMHWPLLQVWPAAQAARVPQPQLPVALQESAIIASQVRHVEPPVPQAPIDGVVQVAPLQQPLGQLVPLQAPPVQMPLEHVWPMPHAGPAPQRQVPLLAQVFALTGLQVAQVSPPAPQVLRLRAWQTLPTQQPLGQLVPSQTHWLPTQRWPPTQAMSDPQRQPSPAQVSARVRSQVEQAPPAGPQLAIAIALQVRPAQQPLGHEVTSHVQVPFMHRWPAPQAAEDPHWQKPVALQLSAEVALHAMHAEPCAPQVIADGV